MKNTVVFGTRYGYWPIVMADYYKDPQFHVFDGFANPFTDKLHLWHNKWPFNCVFEMPLKRLWYKRYFDEKTMDPQRCAFVFFEVTNLAFSRRLLRHIKTRFPKALLLFFFTNPVGSYNFHKLMKVEDLYDAIVTFQKDEAGNRGWKYLEYGYSGAMVRDSDLPESDLFFIGKNKGRLEKLHTIYRLMTEAGVRCDFHITETDKEEQIVPGIHYNHSLSYMETLQHVVKSRCLLELNAGDLDYASIKAAEAVAYRKRLLTNNARIAESMFYDAANMRYFRTPDTIDPGFILQGYTESGTMDSRDLNPAHLVRTLLDELRTGSE